MSCAVPSGGEEVNLLRNIFWLPMWLYLRTRIYFLRRTLLRLQAENDELLHALEEKKS